jgi:hypothetical protein
MFSIESSTELCTGATAHTHNKTRTTIEVAVVQQRVDWSILVEILLVELSMAVIARKTWRCARCYERMVSISDRERDLDQIWSTIGTRAWPRREWPRRIAQGNKIARTRIQEACRER